MSGLSLGEVETLLGIKKSTLQGWVRRGILTKLPNNKADPASVDRYLEQSGKKPAKPAAEQTPEPVQLEPVSEKEAEGVREILAEAGIDWEAT